MVQIPTPLALKKLPRLNSPPEELLTPLDSWMILMNVGSTPCALMVLMMGCSAPCALRFLMKVGSASCAWMVLIKVGSAASAWMV